MKFSEITEQRYATKKFDGKTLPQGKVDELLQMIRLAPTSFNLQPYKVIVITDAKTKAALAPAAYGQSQIESCSHLLVFCADTDVKGNANRVEALVLKSGMPSEKAKAFGDMLRGFAAGKTPEQLLNWAQRQVYLPLSNALNGAKALGFDSCPMEGFNPAEFAKILKLPAHLVPTALCPIGYAADVKPEKKVRFATEDTFLKH